MPPGRAWLLVRIRPNPGFPGGLEVVANCACIFSEASPTTAVNNGIWATIHVEDGKDYDEARKRCLAYANLVWPWLQIRR